MGGREGLGRRMAASLANWLSIARIALVLSLMLVRPLSIFVIFYQWPDRHFDGFRPEDDRRAS